MSGLFVINGFYASMRSAYTEDSVKLQWFDIEWDRKDLSWEDFRNNVLGATNPKLAVEGSLRRIIATDYKNLGFSEAPPNNAVHASASPFEALAERANWLQAELATDPIGAAAIAAGVPLPTLAAWTTDPQIDIGEGKTGSLFDQLEDQSVNDCFAAMQQLAGVPVTEQTGLKNRAFVFLKPGCFNEQTLKLLTDRFASEDMTVLASGIVTGPEISEKKFIDQHYLSIASKASLNAPSTLNPPEAGLKRFQEKHGLTWQDAIDADLLVNSTEAVRLMGGDSNLLTVLWDTQNKTEGGIVKLSGGFYVARIPVLNLPAANAADFSFKSYKELLNLSNTEAKDTLGLSADSDRPGLSAKFLLNGFYAGMRAKFTVPDATLHWYVVQFDMPWQQFRESALGATDPATAVEGSLRRIIFDDWKTLGLAAEPNVGDNGMHASASPFEALAEVSNWLNGVEKPQAALLPLRSKLLETVPEDTLNAWMTDPQVDLPQGGKGSLFDQVEDQSVDECVATLNTLVGSVGEGNGQDLHLVNTAFVFIKPHAVNANVQELVQRVFADKKITILDQGDYTGSQIDENKYIDNHYYSIASKASLSKPSELNPPAAGTKKFFDHFGLTWSDALQLGVLFNAVDGQAALGMTGDEVDAAWAKCKKDKQLVKLSGGFYAGRIWQVTAPLAPEREWNHARGLYVDSVVEAVDSVVEAVAQDTKETVPENTQTTPAPEPTSDETLDRPTVVFVLGGPGAGKGTMCSVAAAELGWHHISAGDLLRAERKKNTANAELINQIIIEGKFVPSSITCGLLKDEMARIAQEKGGKQYFLIDGFPRNQGNEDAWNDVVGAAADVKTMFYFECGLDKLEARILERAKVSGRNDDNIESLRKRFKSYQAETVPIIDLYKARHQCVTIDSSVDRPAVWDRVKTLLCNISDPEGKLVNQPLSEFSRNLIFPAAPVEPEAPTAEAPTAAPATTEQAPATTEQAPAQSTSESAAPTETPEASKAPEPVAATTSAPTLVEAEADSATSYVKTGLILAAVATAAFVGFRFLKSRKN